MLHIRLIIGTVPLALTGIQREAPLNRNCIRLSDDTRTGDDSTFNGYSRILYRNFRNAKEVLGEGREDRHSEMPCVVTDGNSW
jgi:hypothetical protein